MVIKYEIFLWLEKVNVNQSITLANMKRLFKYIVDEITEKMLSELGKLLKLKIE